jgi:sugar lactone lactonase YvrE
MATTGVEMALDAGAELGEGAMWSSDDHALWWVDITRHLIHRFDPGAGIDDSYPVGQPVSAVVSRAKGGLAITVEHGFALFEAATATVEHLVAVEADRPSNRMNDGKCDAHGRFWAGSMAYDFAPGAGSLYRLDPDGTVVRALDKVTISNGICWSLDGESMYYVDSPTGRIDRFDFDPRSGSLAGRRPLVTIPARDGMPDGMTIDEEGCLWVALWKGWAVRRYRPDGALDREVRLPVAQVTSCAFGGLNLDELWITSASTGLTSAERRAQPLAGALFRLGTQVGGMPAFRFGG